jgi:hypothetical protein
VGQRKGRPVIFTLELGEELYHSGDFEQQKQVVSDFVAAAMFSDLQDRVARRPAKSWVQRIMVECECEGYIIHTISEEEGRNRMF